VAKCIGLMVVLGFLCGAVAQAQAIPDLAQFLASASSCQKSVGPESGTGGGPSTQAYCQATCWDGNTVSTNCGGTCGAVDSDCVGQVSGWVTCNGSIVATCQTCPVSCEATNGTACSVNHSQISCYRSDNSIGFCTCLRSAWACAL
jgi:hypothetical protein